MALSQADKTFMSAVAGMNAADDKPMICSAFRTAYGPAAAGLSNRQIMARFTKLSRLDEAKDLEETEGALAETVRRQGIAKRNGEIFRREEELARLDRNVITALADAITVPESHAALAKMADAAVKVLGRGGAEGAVRPEMLKAIGERRRELAEMQKRMERGTGAEAEQAPASAPTQGPVSTGDFIGRA